jgi:hypothetical protein
MKRLSSIFLVLFCSACLEPYAPPASSENLNALVVDGYIDADGTASVTLSRSIPLNGKRDPAKQSGADITIESSDGEIFSLHETAAGIYAAANLAVNKTSTYTLHIVTPDNDYRSDAMKIYPTPPIDSIYWTVSAADRLEIRADSHNADPNSTGYYLLNAIESYEYHAAVYAHWHMVNHVPTPRDPDVYTCYMDERTPNVIASTKGLREDRLTGVRVSVIERSSPKISVRYSILLKQRAISQEEFTYQRLLLASTEQQASLFAQVPGTIPSNVRSTKYPGEYVLGYFSAREIKERRYFIDDTHHRLRDNFYQRPIAYCQPESACGSATAPGGCVPAYVISEAAGIVSVGENAGGALSGITFTTAECSDCTLKGGTTKKPSFW